MYFIHTADIHLGKTYRNSPSEIERYEDFFRCLAGIVKNALKDQVNFVLIGGDLFHTGQILPKTFAKTIETLQPLKEAGIPCIAIEGNHDWIHRRDNISWMEALSEMGYIRLLRPSRTEDGGYFFDPFDDVTGMGGHIEIGGINIYGLGYIGAQAGNHVERICNAVTTKNNLLLFHVGIWKYSPVEIGNMKLEEAHPLAEKFSYVALGHGHKPYVIETPEGRAYAYNPGAPERVNFGEEKYDKGYYFVTIDDGRFSPEFRPTNPRPMLVEVINLEGAENADDALNLFRDQVKEKLARLADERAPLLELKLAGRIGFHPFELGRDRLRLALEEFASLLHIEIKNHLSMVAKTEGEEVVKKSLTEIEKDVLQDLVGAHTKYKDREEELTRLSLAIRDLVLKGDVDDEELLGLIPEED
ncbi:exonuclease SbcCD subunit D [Desulfoprunum benzoelyticum]|jgi:DNA repair exonuclease SbcCD nuclease subunit|uniref:DNA repair exonuclease SbcCD nuclease subunit n=1 Tax=Desulfoprunum benzoelyticum TaxID=1506996 RepID=A0A840URI8_9BACT|nr:exonuclease SbcCD subunit D [Desulfoprunum benzoelyticum]MBB5348402.1 DNA repair exonuclease SbcCD nuclease subunit [Desulfoprunum benzoelyticum]MBM9528740.1 exonuclease SbcCD subunit D [Desulfoprunum benzoelyticum]